MSRMTTLVQNLDSAYIALNSAGIELPIRKNNAAAALEPLRVNRGCDASQKDRLMRRAVYNLKNYDALQEECSAKITIMSEQITNVQRVLPTYIHIFIPYTYDSFASDVDQLAQDLKYHQQMLADAATASKAMWDEYRTYEEAEEDTAATEAVNHMTTLVQNMDSSKRLMHSIGIELTRLGANATAALNNVTISGQLDPSQKDNLMRITIASIEQYEDKLAEYNQTIITAREQIIIARDVSRNYTAVLTPLMYGSFTSDIDHLAQDLQGHEQVLADSTAASKAMWDEYNKLVVVQGEREEPTPEVRAAKHMTKLVQNIDSAFIALNSCSTELTQRGENAAAALETLGKKGSSDLPQVVNLMRSTFIAIELYDKQRLEYNTSIITTSETIRTARGVLPNYIKVFNPDVYKRITSDIDDLAKDLRSRKNVLPDATNASNAMWGAYSKTRAILANTESSENSGKGSVPTDGPNLGTDYFCVASIAAFVGAYVWRCHGTWKRERNADPLRPFIYSIFSLPGSLQGATFAVAWVHAAIEVAANYYSKSRGPVGWVLRVCQVSGTLETVSETLAAMARSDWSSPKETPVPLPAVPYALWPSPYTVQYAKDTALGGASPPFVRYESDDFLKGRRLPYTVMDFDRVPKKYLETAVLCTYLGTPDSAVRHSVASISAPVIFMLSCYTQSIRNSVKISETVTESTDAFRRLAALQLEGAVGYIAGGDMPAEYEGSAAVHHRLSAVLSTMRGDISAPSVLFKGQDAKVDCGSWTNGVSQHALSALIKDLHEDDPLFYLLSARAFDNEQKEVNILNGCFDRDAAKRLASITEASKLCGAIVSKCVKIIGPASFTLQQLVDELTPSGNECFLTLSNYFFDPEPFRESRNAKGKSNPLKNRRSLNLNAPFYNVEFSEKKTGLLRRILRVSKWQPSKDKFEELPRLTAFFEKHKKYDTVSAEDVFSEEPCLWLAALRFWHRMHAGNNEFAYVLCCTATMCAVMQHTLSQWLPLCEPGARHNYFTGAVESGKTWFDSLDPKMVALHRETILDFFNARRTDCASVADAPRDEPPKGQPANEPPKALPSSMNDARRRYAAAANNVEQWVNNAYGPPRVTGQPVLLMLDAFTKYEDTLTIYTAQICRVMFMLSMSGYSLGAFSVEKSKILL